MFMYEFTDSDLVYTNNALYFIVLYGAQRHFI